MSRPPSLAGDPRVRWGFLANTYAKSWLWYPKGYGILHCMDGLLQFEPAGATPFTSPRPFQHTSRRVLLLTPFAIPNNFTVVVFDGGSVSISIGRNRAKIRSVIAECGFEIVDAPPQRMYPFNQRKVWDKHMGPPSEGPQFLSQRFPSDMVLGGIDKPMLHQTPCLSCGANIDLEYHDVKARWYTAEAATRTTPGWEAFDTERALAADETPLDMTCWNCTRRMRVIVHGNEWRMDIWQYFIVEMLVLA